MLSHEEKVNRIVQQLKERKSTAPLSLKKKTVSHKVPKAGGKDHSGEKLDISDLNEIIHIDTEKRICIAEPGATFTKIVDATMKHGLAPTVVPELKTITVGGAVAGCSVESMSYKFGGFHDSCLEYEVVTAKGDVLICTPDNENQLLFQMLHGTFGTLGIITSLKFRLIPAKPFVKMTYEKYKDMEETRLAIEASGAEIVTVAVRRTNIGQNKDEPNLLDVISPDRYTILPNTAGCYDAESAIRTCRLARELLGDHTLVKLEILADQKTLFPNVVETLKAAKVLVDEGFDVMVYTSDDPIIARELEAIGCIAVMPLAGLIGTGLGICNPYNLRIILEEAKIPVLVDAGVGTASDATIAMEMGCAAVLMNSAIANAQQPILMAQAMRHAIEAGRLAYLAGRMPKKLYASASSPLDGMIG